MADIIIDSRENDLWSFFERFPIKSNFSKEQLSIGDIHFKINNTIVLIIERKEYKDFENSIKDGRYREQKNRLLKSNVPIMYIFEGIYSQSSINNTLISAICNCIIRDKILVYNTKTIEDTFNFIVCLSSKLLEFNWLETIDNNSEISKSSISPLDLAKITKKSTFKDNIFELQLMQIPGIGSKCAQAIVHSYPSMMSLCSKYSELQSHKDCELLLSEIQTNTKNKRKVGKVISAKIYNILFSGKMD